MKNIPAKIMAAYLPGDSTVTMKEVSVPEPGHEQVLIKTKRDGTRCRVDIYNSWS